MSTEDFAFSKKFKFYEIKKDYISFSKTDFEKEPLKCLDEIQNFLKNNKHLAKTQNKKIYPFKAFEENIVNFGVFWIEAEK